MLIQKWTDQKLEKLVFIFFNVYIIEMTDIARDTEMK